MTEEFINLIIEKVEQPKTGWTIPLLNNYAFDFEFNPTIKNNSDIILNLLNQYLPFFYFAIPIHHLPNVNPITSTTITRIIVAKKSILSEIAKISKTTIKNDSKTFSKSILTYSGFLRNGGGRCCCQDLETYMQLAEKEWQRLQRLAQQSETQSFAMPLKQTIESKDDTNKGGIYRIYSIDKNNIKKTLYVGLTQRDFQDRWNEHKSIIQGHTQIPSGMHKLYNLLQEEYKNKRIVAEPIIEFNSLQTNSPLSDRDKEAMEFAIISLLKPLGNTSGIDVPYYFTDCPKQRY